ncbi:GNAT family N-acetyltransferase [Flavobacterium caeni]|uniref:Protein N-acetyltransferase, RimJ/RimL family n=1 Tax=Flavobacterium caeni TaxID=490189 RepID=A0A1G5ITK2_9FLAO|nr:GNAT family N-acetyltransferase [Flavobacterium caeni]SCY79070.1 Protein N-acetyltransferase, RimJ/RimL family [Flavobacterium caeni]
MILETQRLILREFEPDDARHLFALNAVPDVIKYTGDPPFQSIAEARSFIDNYDQYRKFGYGRWAVIGKTHGEFLGWCGLKYDAARDETDLGFRFFKQYWNHGFATEAAKGCLDHGFNKLGLQSIVGRAMKQNTASIRVLEKIGMLFEREATVHHGDCGMIYRIAATDLKI